jgi:hypothetical protein
MFWLHLVLLRWLLLVQLTLEDCKKQFSEMTTQHHSRVTQLNIIFVPKYYFYVICIYVSIKSVLTRIYMPRIPPKKMICKEKQFFKIFLLCYCRAVPYGTRLYFLYYFDKWTFELISCLILSPLAPISQESRKMFRKLFSSIMGLSPEMALY